MTAAAVTSMTAAEAAVSIRTVDQKGRVLIPPTRYGDERDAERDELDRMADLRRRQRRHRPATPSLSSAETVD